MNYPAQRGDVLNPQQNKMRGFMKTYNLRRFSKVEILRKISRENLISLLKPYENYFQQRHFKIPEHDSREELDYERLSKILLSPDSSTPKKLADALFHIDEFLTPAGFDAIQRKIEGTEIDAAISRDASSADLVVEVWMRNHKIIENIHDEQYFSRLRSFDYFQTLQKPSITFQELSQKAVVPLEKDINEWFYEKRRGRYAKISVHIKADEIWFLIRHGEPYARQNVIGADGKSVSVFQRLEKYDVLVYNHGLGEIKIYACSKSEKELYRVKFGLHLFGDKNYFSVESKFTLEPLRTLDHMSLLCGDIKGLEWVKLKELKVSHGGPHRETATHKAKDVFASFKTRKYSLPSRGKLIKASLLIKFSDSKTPRVINFGPGNNAQYKRDADAGIEEELLVRRGFIIRKVKAL